MEKLIKACVYSIANKGCFFPVAFFADEGRKRLSGVHIVPMGYSPIKGDIARMSLTHFEELLEKFECRFECCIPVENLNTLSDVYNAFRFMMLGVNKLNRYAIEPKREINRARETDTFTIDELRVACGRVERRVPVYDDGSDNQAALMNLIYATIRKSQDRAAVIDEYSNCYVRDMDGNIYRGQNLIDAYESENGISCTDFEDVLEAYNITERLTESELTYTDLLNVGKKILAVRLYRERNNCSLVEAKHAIDEIEIRR